MDGISFKGFLDYAGLKVYDAEIKKFLEAKDAEIDAKSIKKVVVVGNEIKFFKNANAENSSPADFTVPLTAEEVNAVKDKVGAGAVNGYQSKSNIVDILNTITGNDSTAGSIAEAKKAGDAAKTVADQAQAKATTNEKKLEAVSGDVVTVSKKVDKLNGDESTEGSVKNVVKSAKDELKGNSSSDTSDSTTIEGAKKYADKKAEEVRSSLSTVATSGKASDVKVDNAAAGITSTDVQAALKEINDKVASGGEAGKITVEKTNPNGVAARYTIKQGGSPLPVVIDIPKDMVVKSGEVVTLSQEQAQAAKQSKAGTYIKLVLNDAEGTAIYIPADSLIEYVTSGSTDSDKVKLTISPDHKITASVKAGSIQLADLASDVQSKINLGGNSLQKGSIKPGSANGTISVDGEAVAVTGLGTAAYKAVDYFEKAGTAVEETRKLYNLIGKITDEQIQALFKD